MNVIPFNIPGLPAPETLAGSFITKPISIDAGGGLAGPMLALRAAPSSASTLTDGALCIYPDIDMIAYLFTIQVRSGKKDLLPGLLIHSASASGVCTVLSMSYDLNNNPVLTVSILPEEYLPKILTTYDGATIADVSGIDDRLELTQVFTANSLGVVERLSNDVTHKPKESGNAAFDMPQDLDVISDVCSFYLTRALTLSDTAKGSRTDTAALTIPPVWTLLWSPATAMGLAGFSLVYLLTKTSIYIRNENGIIRWGIEFNLNANRLPPAPRQN